CGKYQAPQVKKPQTATPEQWFQVMRPLQGDNGKHDGIQYQSANPEAFFEITELEDRHAGPYPAVFSILSRTPVFCPKKTCPHLPPRGSAMQSHPCFSLHPVDSRRLPGSYSGKIPVVRDGTGCFLSQSSFQSLFSAVEPDYRIV